MSAMHPRIRHLILDRDGVLNVERADGRYLADWCDWRWIDGALEALAQLHQIGVRVSVATNQSGIGRGCVTREQVDALHAHMCEEVTQAGGLIAGVWVCPHTPDAGCTCRKPLPGLLLQAIGDSGFPPSATLAVGDDVRDVQAAHAAGIATALVRTGKGRAAEGLLARSDVVAFDDLRVLATALLASTPFTVAQTP